MWSIRLLAAVLLLSSAGIVAQNEGIVATIAGGGTPHEGGDENCEDSATSMDGVGINARFNYPWGIQFDPLENALYISDCGCPFSIHSNDRIRKIDVMSGQVTTLAGNSQGYKDGTGKDAKFHHTSGLVIDQQERVLYVADSGNNRIRKVNLMTGQVNTFVGSGESGFVDDVGVRAQVNNPQQLEIDVVKGRRLFLSDTDNHAIRVISLSKGDVTTLAGGSSGLKDGEGREAKFLHPTGISLDLYSGTLYVADHYNHVIRTVDTTNGRVTTLAGGGKQGFKDGQGNEARFNYPEGLYFDSDQQVLYVVEFDNHAIRTVTPKGEVRTLAGGTKGRRDGIGTDARFFHPTGLTFDPRVKRIYVTDQYNHMVRSITGIGSSAMDPHKSALSNTFRKAKSSPYLFVCMVLSVVLVAILLQWSRRGRRPLLRSY